jgi:NAD(P) transhydrogenase subunit alpha
MELVPRITRAQKMDALSAMSTVAGYKAVLLAADTLPRFFPLLTTAAGTVKPARVLVLGAGVAGLQALATARRLGAVTAAYDVRAAAREQVESVGASFVELALETGDAEDKRGYAKALAEDQQARQVALLAEHVAQHDVVITTALIPGRPAPRLIEREGVEGMKPGSVIVDLAAANSGNCAVTRPDERVDHAGVHRRRPPPRLPLRGRLPPRPRRRDPAGIRRRARRCHRQRAREGDAREPALAFLASTNRYASWTSPSSSSSSSPRSSGPS